MGLWSAHTVKMFDYRTIIGNCNTEKSFRSCQTLDVKTFYLILNISYKFIKFFCLDLKRIIISDLLIIHILYFWTIISLRDNGFVFNLLLIHFIDWFCIN